MAKQNPYKTNTGVHIEWFTVKRSTIYALVLSTLGLFGAGLYAYFQVFVDREPEVEQAPETDNTARFLDLDGTVKVRHAGTYEWVNATMGMALNRDDTIRTVGGSTAQVRLFDGTEYLLKPDSILVIEKAYEDPETKAKHVAVKLESGQISLNTPRRNVPGSSRECSTDSPETLLSRMGSRKRGERSSTTLYFRAPSTGFHLNSVVLLTARISRFAGCIRRGTPGSSMISVKPLSAVTSTA